WKRSPNGNYAGIQRRTCRVSGLAEDCVVFLTQLQLRNWRAYRNATFSFLPPDRSGRRNVILIGAQNGYGKTSFLIALYLGLFGREAMSLIEGFTDSLVSDDKLVSYQRLIEGILHRPAKNQ